MLELEEDPEIVQALVALQHCREKEKENHEEKGASRRRFIKHGLSLAVVAVVSGVLLLSTSFILSNARSSPRYSALVHNYTSNNGGLLLVEDHEPEDKPSAYVNPNDLPYTPPHWIQPYIDLHNSQVNQVHDRLKQPTVRWMQWKCRVSKHTQRCGGLADRLKGIFMGLLLSLIDDRVFLIQEWEQRHVENPLHNYLLPNLIDWKGRPHKNFIGGSNNTYYFNTYQEPTTEQDNQLHEFLKETPCDYRGFHNYTGIIFSGNYVTRQRMLNHDVCLPRARQEDNFLRTIFWTLFRWSDKIHARAKELRGPITTNKYYIAVHIRTGRGASWDDPGWERNHENADWDMFADCLQRLQNALEAHCQQRPWAYLASDNQETKEYVQSRVMDTLSEEHQQENNQSHYYLRVPPNLEIMHIDRSRAKDVVDSSAAYETTLAEFKVLMDSTCLIRSGKSGFSLLAARLSRQTPRCHVQADQCDADAIAQTVSTVVCPTFD